jgi:UDP-glucose 4-epimerase
VRLHAAGCDVGSGGATRRSAQRRAVEHGHLPPVPSPPYGPAAADPLPLDEDSPTRTGSERYLFRGEAVPAGVGAADLDNYENLDVEEVVLAHGATVLRLPMVYGERDPMRREEFVLRHVRAGDDRVEIGAGTLLWTKVWVRDAARAIRLAAQTGVGDGTPLNIGERRTAPIIAWAQAILDGRVGRQDRDAP